MSRDIKFRAWDTVAKSWLTSDELMNKAMWSDEGELAYHFSVQLLQYTGLKDKNGTEIYEGDVVNQLDIQQIGNQENPRKQNVIEFNSTSGYDIWPHDIEVIGNIYDNPELLNAK